MERERYLIHFQMKADGDDAEVLVYSTIDSEKCFGEVCTPGDFDKELKEARKNGATRLNVRINSPGGDVYSAVAMRSMIINAGFENVRVMIEGLCASAATLFATIPGANVVIAEGSEFMIHNPMTITWGNAAEMEKTAEHLHKLEEQFGGMYAAKTGQSEAQIREWMDAETWFTAKEACEYGFCDELLETESVAACVSARDIAVMTSLYRNVPDGIAVQESAPDDTARNDISNEAPVAGDSTEIQHEEDTVTMEIKDLTQEQLLAENPALVEQIQRSAMAAERQRQEDIDAITPPVAEYQRMADDAKKNGTSFTDYQRALVAAQKQKGQNFLEARKEETAPAQAVAGGAADDMKDEATEMKQFANDVARYATEYRGNADGGMY